MANDCEPHRCKRIETSPDRRPDNSRVAMTLSTAGIAICPRHGRKACNRGLGIELLEIIQRLPSFDSRPRHAPRKLATHKPSVSKARRPPEGSGRNRSANRSLRDRPRPSRRRARVPTIRHGIAMYKSLAVGAVIPAYNEEDNISCPIPIRLAVPRPVAGQASRLRR